MATSVRAVVSFILTILLGFPLSVLSTITVKDLQTNETVKTFADLSASFGPEFPELGLEGRIVMASPTNACHPIAHAPPLRDEFGWIVMIARGGNCKFAEKVESAQDANFSAAIIHNFKSREGLLLMMGNSSKVRIPSTFVGYSDGMQLLKMFKNHSEYIAQILEQENIDYRMYLWPFAIVVGVCFFMVMLFLVIKFLRDHLRTTVTRLSKRHLKKIPIKKFKKGQYYDTCAICLDEYEDGEKIRILPCDHAYHMKCIDPWLTQNKKTCPVCKRRVIPGRDPNSDSDSDDGGSSRERAPLLRASSQQSHGSITRRADSSSQVPPDRLIDPLDESQGAVGGSGISGQVQVRVEQEIDGGEQREARRPRRERREERPEGSGAVSEEPLDDRKAERREKRKRKKDKKREEKRAKRHETEAEESGHLLATQTEEGDQPASVVAIETEAEAQPDESADAIAEAAAEGYINPSYSESQEVVVPGSGKKREMSEVV